MADAKPPNVLPTATQTPTTGTSRRHVLLRLFGISLWGYIKLLLLCIIVGSFVMASQLEPDKTELDAVAAMQGILTSAIAVGRWAAVNFWHPAFTGASLVLPLWVLWRVVSLPFRK